MNELLLRPEITTSANFVINYFTVEKIFGNL